MLTSYRVQELYTGNGVASTFAIQFRFFAATDLRVTEIADNGDETVLALGTHYSVTGEGDPAGGSLTLLAGALASGKQLVIDSAAAPTQGYKFRNLGAFDGAKHEDAFDYLMRLIQQLYAVVGITPETAATIRLTLPDEDGIKRWNGLNHRLENLDNPLNAYDAVTQSSLESYVAGVIQGGEAVSPGFFQILGDAFTSEYTLASDMAGGVNEAFLLVAINGVLQEPGISYTYDPVTFRLTFPGPLGVGARCWVIQMGYAKGYNAPRLYTAEVDIPAAGSGLVGQLIRVKTSSAPEEWRACMQKSDGTYVWQPVVTAPAY